MSRRLRSLSIAVKYTYADWYGHSLQHSYPDEHANSNANRDWYSLQHSYSDSYTNRDWYSLQYSHPDTYTNRNWHSLQHTYPDEHANSNANRHPLQYS
jgi:hypothetical protein